VLTHSVQAYLLRISHSCVQWVITYRSPNESGHYVARQGENEMLKYFWLENSTRREYFGVLSQDWSKKQKEIYMSRVLNQNAIKMVQDLVHKGGLLNTVTDLQIH
jgi:hypothetical protein